MQRHATTTEVFAMEKMMELLKDIYGFDIEVKPIYDREELLGFYHMKEKIIYINVNHDFKDNDEIVSTLVHEGRHAWQHKHGYMEKFQIKHSEDGFNAYYNSPLERDARWASEIYLANRDPHMLTQESTHIDWIAQTLEGIA